MRIIHAALLTILLLTGCGSGADQNGTGNAFTLPGLRPTPLQLHRVVDGVPEAQGIDIPASAVQVYTYEVPAAAISVQAETIAVDYGKSAVLFNRRTGAFLRRFTVADGYPDQRESIFPTTPISRHPRLTGPGLIKRSDLSQWESEDPRQWRPPDGTHAPAVWMEYGGRVWEGMQPRNFVDDLTKGQSMESLDGKEGSLTGVLNLAESQSFLRSHSADGSVETRYTVKEGLAGNIITALAAAEGTLWAASADIYDAESGRWSTGGLSRFDSNTGRWARVESIEGRPVRHITLLQAVGDDLWVGFREGSGVTGDWVMPFRGFVFGHYRPKVTAVTLARLCGGVWTVFSRPPLDAQPGLESPEAAARSQQASGKDIWPPQERFFSLLKVENGVLVVSAFDASGMRNRQVSLLNIHSSRWRHFDLLEDLSANKLHCLQADKGEVLALTDKGVRRWLGDKEVAWETLEPGGALISPSIGAAAVVGDELWVGHRRSYYGCNLPRGIGRFDERNLTWSYMRPDVLGTAADVHSIATVGDETYVLFRNDTGFVPKYSMTCDPYLDPREGVGRLTAGKWEFPLRLEGVSHEGSQTRSDFEELPEPAIEGLAAAGGKVYLSTRSGVYAGPGKWQKVVAFDDGEFWHHMTPTPDMKKIVVRTYKNVWVINPARGETAAFSVSSQEGDALLEPPVSGFPRHFIPVSLVNESNWAVSGLGDRHYVVETEYAVWIVLRGQLVRLDRKQLVEYLGPFEPEE